MARGKELEMPLGGLVSSYTRTTSSAVTGEGGFCEDLRATISAAVAQLNMEDRGFMASYSPCAPMRSCQLDCN